ncbi:MAG: rod shape-determining protein RodA [Eubacterium sp.]|nr:rod shape-determining protein RodA [Eubacterium sp.]
MKKQYRIKNIDFRLIFYVVLLTVIGILVIGSARESVQNKQILGLAGGLVVMVVVTLIDYSYLIRFRWIFYILNIGLLLLVYFIGDDAGGATRWIEIAGIRFQPTELAKIVLILFFAGFFARFQEKVSDFKILATAVILAAIPIFGILKQPDLSSSIVTILIFLAMVFVAGVSYKIVAGALAVFLPVFAIGFWMILQPDQNILHGYQVNRILAWLHPEDYPDLAYQQMNSIMAIGSGQLWGKGLNNNLVASVKNGNFISAPQTDFIFAVSGEELGFVGCAIIIILLFLIALECIILGRRAKDLSGKLICTGMAALIGFQSFVNLGVATGLIPNTGVTLPFVSYGLSSLLSLFIGIGMVLNVGLQPKKYG